MLPAFPKIETWRREKNRQLIMLLAEKIAPMLAMIDRHAQFEGQSAEIFRHDDTIGHSPFEKIVGKIRISSTLLANFGEEELQKYLETLAEQLARGVSEHFYAEMDRVTAEVGNVVDAGGRPLSEDLILEMIDKMDHSFEPDGTWNPPTLLAPPKVVDRFLQESNADASGSLEFQQSLRKIVERKRDDFRSREADRVLAG